MTMTERVKRMKPHRSTRVLLIYLPIFAALVLLALRIAGVGYSDLRAYALELAPRSLYPIAAIGLTAGLMKLTGFDLCDDVREELIRQLTQWEGGGEEGKWPLTKSQFGAFLVLAGETLAWGFFITLFLRALTTWQG